MNRLFLLLLLAVSLRVHAQHIHPHYEDGNLYLKVKESVMNFRGISPGSSDLALRSFLGNDLANAGISSVKRMFPATSNSSLANVFRIQIADPASVDAALRILNSNPSVEYAEKVPLKKFFFVPNDTLYSNAQQWNLFKINAALAWNYVSPGTNATIAVVDEGVDISHPDLMANVWHNALEIPNNGIDDDGNFYIDDFDSWDFGDNDNSVTPQDSTWSHGTHVSGIASAVSNNLTGIASIGYNCKLMALKGSNSNIFMTNGYEAIAYAIENGADVINLSWGSPATSLVEENVVEFAKALNVVLVAASGNSGTDEVNYPAGYPYVISVASTGQNDVRVFSSNYGPTIDLCAPGINILSTTTGGGYGLKTGTSMAAPLVAGLACLMRSYHPGISVPDLEACLKSSADNIDFMNPNFLGLLGAGRINAFNAMSCVVASRFKFDVWVEGLQVPGSISCEPLLTPVVRIRNHGTDTLTRFEYHYRIDQGALISGLWTGSASYDSILNFSLPLQTFSSGNHSIKFFTSWPNQQVDWNLFNDTLEASFEVLASGINPPFHESFDDTSSTRNWWTVLNPDQSIGWKFKNQSIGGLSTGLAWINLFNYHDLGQKDALVSPPFNLYGLDSAWISFNYASRMNYRSMGFDTLRVFVSADCGSTYLPAIAVFSLDSSFASSADTTNTFFKANQAAQWCDSLLVQGCLSIDLTPFTGQQSLMVKLETSNQAGNNFYLDDFRFEGVFSGGSTPQPQITLSQPLVCEGGVVTMSATSIPQASSWQWVVQGANPDTVNGQSAFFVFPVPGTYNVQLSATNASGTGSSSLSQGVTVSPLPSVQIISDSNIVCLGDSLLLSVSGNASYTWQSDGVISTNTGSSIHILGSVPGTFTVTLNALSAQGCVADTSAEFIVTSCLGVQEMDETPEWSVFFDAGQRALQLVFQHSEGGRVELMNLAGQVLWTENVSRGASRLRLSGLNLTPGIYLVRHLNRSLKVLVTP